MYPLRRLSKNMDCDFLIERKLKNGSGDLHRRAADSQVVLNRLLQSYRSVFPHYTDHSILHSLDLLYYSNMLIGPEQIENINVDECYVLVMACLLHDVGMGVRENDFRDFMAEIEGPDFLKSKAVMEFPEIIRDYHHELAGKFIIKYKDLFDIPSDEHLFAIVQASRGHRKTDLYDEKEYPDIRLENGNIIHTAYIAALIRLSDELDVASDRNPEIIYDINKIENAYSRICFEIARLIKRVEFSGTDIILHETEVPDFFAPYIQEMFEKVKNNLDYCRKLCEDRTPFRIRQNNVLMKKVQKV